MKKQKDEEIAELFASAIKMLHDSQKLNQQTLDAAKAMKSNSHITYIVSVILILSLIAANKYFFN